MQRGGRTLFAGAWIFMLAAGGVTGCTPQARGPAIGTSTAGDRGAADVLPDGGVVSSEANKIPVPSDFRTSMTHVSDKRFFSRGHAGGRWDADVYADPSGADALRRERWPIPVGARFVEEHFERSDGGAGPIMMMEKRPPGFDPARGDWRYVAIGARGDVVKDGAIESCAACHGEAPGDAVFRAGDP